MYTKGEWYIREMTNGSFEIRNPSGTGASIYTIAKVENVDDARLIAAALDMYNSCKTILEIAAIRKGDATWDTIYSTLAPAIVKAEGR